jgi:hypothetical protein
MKCTKNSLRLCCILLLLTFLQSCYSVRMVNTNGVPQPDPMNTVDGFYRHKSVTELDTVVKLKTLEKEFTLLEKCGDRGFYSIEYRNTFGGLLRSLFSFGKKRTVKIKYVCLKESN